MEFGFDILTAFWHARWSWMHITAHVTIKLLFYLLCQDKYSHALVLYSSALYIIYHRNHSNVYSKHYSDDLCMFHVLTMEGCMHYNFRNLELRAFHPLFSRKMHISHFSWLCCYIFIFIFSEINCITWFYDMRKLWHTLNLVKHIKIYNDKLLCRYKLLNNSFLPWRLHA